MLTYRLLLCFNVRYWGSPNKTDFVSELITTPWPLQAAYKKIGLAEGVLTLDNRHCSIRVADKLV